MTARARTVCPAALLLAATAGLMGAAASAPDGMPADATLVDRVLLSGSPVATSYIAERTMPVSARGGRMRARLRARTELLPGGRFRFQVIERDGSNLLYTRVLLAALEREQRSLADGEAEGAALTPANYRFEAADPTPEGLVSIRLHPRRRAPMLIDGAVRVDEREADLVQLDGRLVEPPSWWTPTVTVVMRYARVAGVRMPVSLTSRTEARIGGRADFGMTYEYRAVNGRAVGPSAGAQQAHRVDHDNH